MTSLAYLCRNTVFAATTGAKHGLVVAAPAGHGLKCVKWGVSFDGVTASAVPAVVEPTQITLGAAGTAGGSPPSAVQIRGRAAGGSAPTVTHNYTAEPTTATALHPFYVSPNGGVFVMDNALGREFECDSSAGTIKALGLRLNVSAAVNVLLWMEVEAVG